MLKVKCERCQKDTKCLIMSWFNKENICMQCSEDESKDPRCKEAKRAELNAVKQGNFNFEGIGYHV